MKQAVLEMDPSTGTSDYVVIPVLKKGETPEDSADIPSRIEELRSEMLLAAEQLEFESSAALRDQIEHLRTKLKPSGGQTSAAERGVGRRGR